MRSCGRWAGSGEAAMLSEKSAHGMIGVRAPACPPRTHGAQPVAVLRLGFPECSPRTHGAQPVAVLRLGFPGGSPRTHGAQPMAVLRLARRPGGRLRNGGEGPRRV